MKTRQERKARQDELLALRPAVEDELRAVPGVVGVGVGFKEKNGRPTREFAFRVYVEEKKPLAELAPGHFIPPTLHGIPTDVIRLPRARRLADRGTYRPLQGGIAIGPLRGGIGTLGWFGTLSGGDKVLITNHHVAFDLEDPAYYHHEDADGGLGELKIGQPYYYKFCGCCCDCDVIGKVLVAKDDDSIDCALVRIDDELAGNLRLEIANGESETALQVRGVAEAVCGDVVEKIGMKSGHTRGFIAEIAGVCSDVTEDIETTLNTGKSGQIFIYPAEDETYSYEDDIPAFSYKGDSGSAILNEDGEIVGLLWAGDIIKLDADDSDLDVTIACHFQDVLDFFSDEGFAVTVAESPAGGDDRDYAGLHRPKHIYTNQDAANWLRWELSQLPFGKQLLQCYEAHREEVMDLVNHERAVTVAWHRNRGPAWLAHLIKSARDKTHLIPPAIDGITPDLLLTRMSAVLRTHGSPELQRTLDEHALEVIHCFENINSIRMLLQNIGRHVPA